VSVRHSGISPGKPRARRRPMGVNRALGSQPESLSCRFWKRLGLRTATETVADHASRQRSGVSDDVDEFVCAVAVAARKVDEFSGADQEFGGLGVAGDGDAAAAAEFE
jgi:hypothetical protein